MKSRLKSLLFLLLTFIYVSGHSQDSSTDSLDAKVEVFSIVETMPVFPGGEEAMFKFLMANIKYPQKEKEQGLSGTVYVTFVIERDGSISDIRVLKEIPGGPGFTEEAIRVISSMPKWIPGKQKGEPVPVQFNLPLKWKQVGNSNTPKWLVTMKEGSALLDNRQFKEAIELFNKALKISPDQPEVLFERAAAYFNSQNEDKACKDWYTIMLYTNHDPHFKEAKAFFSQHCRKQGEVTTYMEVFNDGEGDQSIREGTYKKYFQGFLICEGQYANSLKEGEWKYYLDKKLILEGSHLNDKKNGTWTYWREDKKISDHFYTAPNIDSIYVYYENGDIHSKIKYKQAADTVSEFYYHNGQLKALHYWIGEDKNVKVYFSNGQLHRHSTFRNGYPFNDLILLDFAGNPMEKEKIIEGNGFFINYSIDSLDQLKSQLSCELRNGLPNGFLKVQHKTGVTTGGFCRKGYKMGKWEALENDGTIKVIEYKEPYEEEVALILKSDEDYGGLLKPWHMPVFPGGEVALFRFLGEHIKYPKFAKEYGIMGTVYVTFIVNEAGKVSDINILRGVDPLIDDEALRVMLQMPEWVPALSSGLPVSVRYNLPIKFSLR